MIAILSAYISALIFFGIYFTPTIVAGLKGNRNLLAIFLLNLLTGWSVIGWGAALVWACIKQK